MSTLSKEIVHLWEFCDLRLKSREKFQFTFQFHQIATDKSSRTWPMNVILQEYSVQITFRQQWNDNRLAFNDMDGRIKYLTMTDSKKVWMPDTFFRNEKHGKFHKIIQPNLYIRVYPNGDILYSIRWDKIHIVDILSWKLNGMLGWGI